MCCGIVFVYSDGALLNITLNVKSSKGISFASNFLPHAEIFQKFLFLLLQNLPLFELLDKTSTNSKNNFLINAGSM